MKRFGFGKNWRNYSSLVDEARIKKAELHLQDRFGIDVFTGFWILAVGAVYFPRRRRV
jgi:hypothetical protein